MIFLHSSIAKTPVVSSPRSLIFIFNKTNRHTPKGKIMSEASVSVHIFPGRVSTMFNKFAVKVAQYRVYRRTLTELQDLSDRDLADLGLHRSMLRSVAYQSAYDA